MQYVDPLSKGFAETASSPREWTFVGMEIVTGCTLTRGNSSVPTLCFSIPSAGEKSEKDTPRPRSVRITTEPLSSETCSVLERCYRYLGPIAQWPEQQN